MNTIVPFSRSVAAITPKGQIVDQSPDERRVIVKYLDHPDTKSTDPIRLVVSNPPKTKA